MAREEWKCQRCGHLFNQNREECPDCGYTIYRFTGGATNRGGLSGDKEYFKLLWVCSDCGHEHEMSVAECTECGSDSIDQNRTRLEEAEYGDSGMATFLLTLVVFLLISIVVAYLVTPLL